MCSVFDSLKLVITTQSNLCNDKARCLIAVNTPIDLRAQGTEMIFAIDPMQKHIMLLKLVDAYENVPDFDNGPVRAMTPQREWLSKLGAIFNALGVQHSVNYRTHMGMLSQHKDFALNNIMSQVGDAIEELKLDLELSGKSEVGSVYQPGEVYNFISDLKAIIGKAQKNIFVIDPSHFSNTNCCICWIRQRVIRMIQFTKRTSSANVIF